ncbi:MAG: hypothetical protein N838_23420 [Thiohalocapsa sp. PB-PSB1]|nr:MAG: hypothetical protein N838_23420 [Thiohalocapsa sp. PB-PSB1]
MLLLNTDPKIMQHTVNNLARSLGKPTIFSKIENLITLTSEKSFHQRHSVFVF